MDKMITMVRIVKMSHSAAFEHLQIFVGQKQNSDQTRVPLNSETQFGKSLTSQETRSNPIKDSN